MGTFTLNLSILPQLISVQNREEGVQKHMVYGVGVFEGEAFQVVSEGNHLGDRLFPMRSCLGESFAAKGANLIKVLFLGEDEDVVVSRHHFEQYFLSFFHLLSGKDVHLPLTKIIMTKQFIMGILGRMSQL